MLYKIFLIIYLILLFIIYIFLLFSFIYYLIIHRFFADVNRVDVEKTAEKRPKRRRFNRWRKTADVCYRWNFIYFSRICFKWFMCRYQISIQRVIRSLTNLAYQIYLYHRYGTCVIDTRFHEIHTNIQHWHVHISKLFQTTEWACSDRRYRPYLIIR